MEVGGIYRRGLCNLLTGSKSRRKSLLRNHLGIFMFFCLILSVLACFDQYVAQNRHKVLLEFESHQAGLTLPYTELFGSSSVWLGARNRPELRSPVLMLRID